MIRSTPGAGPATPPPGYEVGVIDPTPEATPRAVVRRTPRPTPTPKPGILKRSLGAIPFIGPRIAGEKKDGNSKKDKDREKEERESEGPGAEPVIQAEPTPELYAPPAEGGQTPAGTPMAPASGRVPGAGPVVDLDKEPSVEGGDAPFTPAPILRPFPGEEPAALAGAGAVGGPPPASKAPAAAGDEAAAATAGEAEAAAAASPGAAQAAALAAVTPDPLLRASASAAPVGQPPPVRKTPAPSAVAASPAATPAEPPAGLPPPTPAAQGAGLPPPMPQAAVATPPAAPNPAATAVASAPPATAGENGATSPTLESTDLNFPNPAVEESEPLRARYSAAVLAGRAGKYAEAAQLFREYASNHALSKLSPRALFLAAILEPDATKAAQDGATLKEKFPDSKYVPELARRRPSPADEAAVNVASLEEELSSTPGGPRETEIRLQLGRELIRTESYDRALQVLIPALETTVGTPDEAEILILISDAALAKRDVGRATQALEELVRRHPEAAVRPRVRLNQGLLFEESGAYSQARSMYQALLVESPQASEAQLARERLQDLRML